MGKEEDQILSSWRKQSLGWINAIDNQIIDTRNLVTNEAIINSVTRLNPKLVLDIGCGEGWLVRALSDVNIHAVGIDGSLELIENARSKGSGTFELITYEEISVDAIRKLGNFDLCIFNYALFGKDLTEVLLKKIGKLDSIRVVIQTIHPGHPAFKSRASGWVDEDWSVIGENIADGYHWFFRTMLDWEKLFHRIGFRIEHQLETKHPLTGDLISVIFTISNMSDHQ